MNREYSNLELLFMLLGGAVLLFIIAPVISTFFHTSFPDLVSTAKDSEFINSLFTTLLCSFFGTLILSFFAIPLAYILARKQFPLKGVVLGLIDIPVMIPHSVAGIAILTVISRESFIGNIADSFGVNLIGTNIAIGLAMSFVSIPFLINGAREGFLSVPIKLEKAAFTLGASTSRVFFQITLPLAWRPILTGMIMMWARGLSEFGAVIIVAYYPKTTPVLIFERFNSFGLKYAIPASVLFILVTFFFFILLRIISREKDVRS